MQDSNTTTTTRAGGSGGGGGGAGREPVMGLMMTMQVSHSARTTHSLSIPFFPSFFRSVNDPVLRKRLHLEDSP
jgi:hypothetical protein